ncbi:MAG: type II toxin-antitoxin system death-on-curing family toxin [Candidatus Nanopelagicales bacterium]|nr:type II toxin-antitoxin system death-on-curing family toxin [Candidatus Nanopelagicales bacterium]
MIFLTLDELLGIAARVIDGEVALRDAGLLESAAARPQTTVFGADAYPDLHSKTAALLISICKNHALVDGNKRLALAAAIVMLGINGWVLTLTNDEAYDLVIAIASGELDEVDEVADRLRNGSRSR